MGSGNVRTRENRGLPPYPLRGQAEACRMIRCRGRIDRTTMQHNSMPPIVQTMVMATREFGHGVRRARRPDLARAAVLRRDARRLAADAC